MNCFNGIGRITHDLELKENQQGKKYCRFSLAINSGVKNEDGKDMADFINCVAWEQTAENLCKYQKKGSQIGITGRLHTYSYDGQDGQKKYSYDVIISKLEFLESKSKDDRPEPTSPDYSSKNQVETVASVVNSTDPFEDIGRQVAIDNDLPF